MLRPFSHIARLASLLIAGVYIGFLLLSPLFHSHAGTKPCGMLEPVHSHILAYGDAAGDYRYDHTVWDEYGDHDHTSLLDLVLASIILRGPEDDHDGEVAVVCIMEPVVRTEKINTEISVPPKLHQRTYLIFQAGNVSPPRA